MAGTASRYGLARVLSKRGLCSRTQAATWIAEGRVRLNGCVVRDPEFPVRLEIDRVEVEGADAGVAAPLYLVLNKPRGLVTSARDERGRDTVYRCFDGASLPWIAPVGRLDKASAGLLFFTNDPAWAAAVTDPARGPRKTYHVQVDCIPDAALLAGLVAGVQHDGETLAAVSASLLRHGQRNAWLEIVLDEGRNRHIRRLLEAHGVGVLQLVRVAIGAVSLGTLAKGAWRELTRDELQALGAPTRSALPPG